MSKHNRDYTKYAKEYVEAVEKVETLIHEADEEADEEAVEKAPEPVVKPVVGIVTDCARLNVRKEPSADAEVAFVIDATTSLVVFEEESTEDFYKICTSAGTEGYCMKRYITLMS